MGCFCGGPVGFYQRGAFFVERMVSRGGTKELLKSIFPTESESYLELSVSLSGIGFFCICLCLAIKV